MWKGTSCARTTQSTKRVRVYSIISINGSPSTIVELACEGVKLLVSMTIAPFCEHRAYRFCGDAEM